MGALGLIGDPAPPDGSLTADALTGGRTGPLGLYLHVPFCRVRCGYCDFTTYAPGDLAGYGDDLAAYPQLASAEVDLAARVLGDLARPVETVFIGGGTPTLLPASELLGMLQAVRSRFGLADGAEVTVEANPDTVTPELMSALATGGVTRVSLGMQSAVPHVLAALERTHDPANVASAVTAAKQAGLAVSVDLIYGTPGESDADWLASLEAAAALQPEHVSAYALVVEEGTSMARRVRRGELAMPDDDAQAQRYETAEAVLSAAGYRWYELSNWARPGADGLLAACQHNLGYWRGGQWWGVGPGAHSHIGGTRWWNVRHPRAYADRLRAAGSPALGRETLSASQRYDEWVLLGIRLAEGLPAQGLRAAGRDAVVGLSEDGLVEVLHDEAGVRLVLTLRGRLLADLVTRRLLGW